jgi:hypothetical protein
VRAIIAKSGAFHVLAYRRSRAGSSMPSGPGPAPASPPTAAEAQIEPHFHLHDLYVNQSMLLDNGTALKFSTSYK